jgi:hypothetical protein
MFKAIGRFVGDTLGAAIIVAVMFGPLFYYIMFGKINLF